jgi:nucleoid-associated protein YgaU
MSADRPPGSLPLSRLAAAAGLMAAGGAVLPLLAPHPLATARSLAAVQRLAETAGGDEVVLRVAGLLLWSAWAWGALGLALTAVGALPGLAGAVARGLLRFVVPGAVRRAAAVALGVGIGLTGTVGAGTALAAPAVPVSGPAPGAPDWPTGSPAVPDRPPSAAQQHVVAPGDCLWRIAAAALPDRHGAPADAEVAGAVRAWWAANAAVIGPDPDLLLPGQVLHAPTGADR